MSGKIWLAHVEIRVTDDMFLLNLVSLRRH